MNYYTYYSYEPFGRGYIGSRGCECSPTDDEYLGSYSDKTFTPSGKIILDQYTTRQKAVEAEVKLHEFYQVDINPHFANKSRQTSHLFSYSAPKGERTGEKHPCYGKIRVNNGIEEKVVYENKIPIGWHRGRLRNPNDYATPVSFTRGKLYEKFIQDIVSDDSILSLPNKTLAKLYNTSSTSIRRWKKSLCR